MGKTDLSTFNNDWYRPGNPIRRLLWYFVNLLFMMNRWQPFGGVRIFFLRIFGAKIGRGVVIKPGVNVKFPWKLRIGNHVWIGEGVWIDNLAEVSICNHACISQGAMLLCGNHNYRSASFDLMVGKISIEDGVWIGAQAIVCPGVVCESHAVLSVKSVATSNLEAYGIYQGNPAQKIKQREIQ